MNVKMIFNIPNLNSLTASSLENLRSLNGVQSLDFQADHSLEVSFESTDLDLISQFLDRINEIKSEIKLKIKSFTVNQLSCDGCANSATRLLTNQLGVVYAQVNFSSKSAVIIYQSEQTNEEKLKAALAQLGFELVID